jgi:hypothetical protein
MSNQEGCFYSSTDTQESRIRRYKAHRDLKLCAIPVYFMVFVVAAYFVSNMLDSAPGGLGQYSATFLFTLVMFCAGDLYRFARNRIENHIYCPRYDSASQDRPQFFVPDHPSPLRFAIFLLAELAVPLALLHVLLYYGVVQLQPGLCPTVAAGYYALAFGAMGIKLPMSVGALLGPFIRRLPRPD